MCIMVGGAISALLTSPPKAESPGCHVLVHTSGSCTPTLADEYHGYPFDETAVGAKSGCVNPGKAYAAVEVSCG